MSRELKERFFKKVSKNGPLHPVLGTRCWLWTAYLNSFGYGTIKINKKMELAHRVIYQHLV